MEEIELGEFIRNRIKYSKKDIIDFDTWIEFDPNRRKCFVTNDGAHRIRFKIEKKKVTK